MNQNNRPLDWIYSQDIESKKTWYSSVAQAYNQTRPGYPQELMKRVLELANIPGNGRILEIGSGPGNATLAFAPIGFSMVCLEPNPDFCQLARQNCQQYSNVEIINTSFEEWQGDNQSFDAVLAATSIHWVSSEITYFKASDHLKENGPLILLWNVIPEPNPNRYHLAQDIYETYAPSLTPYEDRETQKARLKGMENKILESGKFVDIISDFMACQVVYSLDEYLMLLSTLSPYIQLEQHNRDRLFENLRERMRQNDEHRVNLTYLSAFQIARNNLSN